MEEHIVEGVVLPDDEDVVVIPTGYSDPMITKEHFSQKGENVVTCIFSINDPLNKIGKEVICPECGKKFMVVRQEDMPNK